MEQPLLIKNRYRVTRVLRTQPDYAALLATDIEDRERTEYLVNVYEGQYRKRFVRCFADVRAFSGFVRSFTAGESVCALFAYTDGRTIDEVFYRGATHDWQTRLYYAEQLFHLALELSGEPPELACAAFLSENLIVRLAEERVCVNGAIIPLEGCCARELHYLLTDQLKKVLIRRYKQCPKEYELLCALEYNEFDSTTALYSYWLELRRAIEAQYAAIDKKNFFSRELWWFFQNVLRLFKRGGKRR